MNNFELYAEIQSQIKDLQDKAKALVRALVQEIDESGEKNQKFDFGTFSLVERKKYTYSEELASMQSELKEAKRAEEENQKPEIVTTLSYRAK